MESYLINRGDNSGAALENIDQGILSSQVPMEIPGINLLQISFLKKRKKKEKSIFVLYKLKQQ
jgi:hypothetical protein